MIDSKYYKCNRCNAGIGCCSCNCGHRCGIPVPQGPTGPQGEMGPTGPDGLAATISVESASRVPFDNNPSVVNVGTPQAAILRFSIPEGMPGATGLTGATAPLIYAQL